MTSVYNNNFKHSKIGIMPFLFVGFLLFLWSKGLMLKIFEIHEKYDILKISAVTLIVLSTSIFILKKPKKTLFENFYYWAILAILLFSSLPTFITGTFTYGQDPIETLRRTQNYYAYFIFIILFYWLGKNALAIKKLNLVIVSFSVVLCCLFILCAIYPSVGRTILISDAYLPDRFGLQRLTTLSATVPFISYSIIYLFLLLAHGRGQKTLLAIVPFLIMVFFLLFVSISRSSIIAMSILVIVYVLFKLPLRNKLVLLYASVLILVSSEVLFTNSPFDLICDSYDTLVSETINVEGNVGIRIEGVKYLIDGFSSTGGIGFGLVSTERTQWNVLSEGFSRGYNPADMGIFGVFLLFGFPAIILTIVICLKLFNDILKSEQLIVDIDILIINKALAGYFALSILMFSPLFFWDFFSLSWGIFFYMVWASTGLIKYSDHENFKVISGL